MKVCTEDTKFRYTKFKDLSPGDVFRVWDKSTREYYEEVHMKLCVPAYTGSVNSVEIAKGYKSTISPDRVVIHYPNATLVLDPRE